jgi:hypothetical protein
MHSPVLYPPAPIPQMAAPSPSLYPPLRAENSNQNMKRPPPSSRGGYFAYPPSATPYASPAPPLLPPPPQESMYSLNPMGWSRVPMKPSMGQGAPYAGFYGPPVDSPYPPSYQASRDSRLNSSSSPNGSVIGPIGVQDAVGSVTSHDSSASVSSQPISASDSITKLKTSEEIASDVKRPVDKPSQRDAPEDSHLSTTTSHNSGGGHLDFGWNLFANSGFYLAGPPPPSSSSSFSSNRNFQSSWIPGEEQKVRYDRVDGLSMHSAPNPIPPLHDRSPSVHADSSLFSSSFFSPPTE